MKSRHEVLRLTITHEIADDGEYWTRVRCVTKGRSTQVMAQTDFKRVDGVFAAVEKHLLTLGDVALPF